MNSETDDQELDSNKPLMCHQSEWQQYILRRYGNDTCLLDATYNTTVYEMPLYTYMLCCLTNAGYVVVASFLVNDETSGSIEAGLRIIAEWNPDWPPGAVMCDFCEAQLSAVERVFPGDSVILQ